MIEAQVVIIGGGAMGTSLLYHLVKSGWSDVVLLEKNDLTHGSTWHAAGLCTHFAHNPTIQELRASSIRLYRDILPNEIGESCGFHPTGAMRVTRNPDRMDEFAHVAGLSAFTGYPLELLSPQQIADLHPLTRLDGLIGGIYEPDDGHVDPVLATNAMAQIAIRDGGDIQRYTPVHDIRHDGHAWLVETADTTYRSAHVVNAAGTWGWEIGEMMGLNVPSVPVLHQYLVTDTIEAVVSRMDDGLAELPIIRDPEESWYVRQERDGLIIGPYERDAQTWSVEGVPPEFGAELLPPDLDRVLPIIEAAIARIPALGTGGVKSVINGPITFSPDANPLIGPAQGIAGAWLLTGSSMGIMEGGGAGQFLAHWMTHGAPPMDAMAVDPRRFGAWADQEFRVAKAVECFGLQFGLHYPHEERSEGRDLRRSPLHDRMIARGAVMGAVHGWERPNWFSDAPDDQAEESFRRSNWFEPVTRECAAASETIALADLSAFSKFEISGPGVAAFLDTLGANRAPKTGRIGLTHALTPTGGVLSEFTVARLAEDRAYLTSAAAAEEIDHDLLRSHAAVHDVTLQNCTDDLAVLGVMGPYAAELLDELTDTDLDDFPWLAVQDIDIADIPVRALRLSYIGELGWELHVANDQAGALFDVLEDTGDSLGLGLYGAYAANAMRLEKGIAAWGADLTTERTALEAGLDAFVHPEGRQFTGRDAMLARQDDSPWQLVLLEVETDHDDPVDPFHAHAVHQGDRIVGIVTSGAFGHRTGMALALAYLREPAARSGLSVNILGRLHPAEILDQPPYDPDNLRPRGKAF